MEFLSEKETDAAKQVFTSIGNQYRIKIMQLIHKNNEMSVKDLQDGTGMNQVTTSQHLKNMLIHGIVVRRSDGRRRMYALNYDKLKAIEKSAKMLLG